MYICIYVWAVGSLDMGQDPRAGISVGEYFAFVVGDHYLVEWYPLFGGMVTTIWGVGDHYLGGGDHYCARTDAQCGVHCGAAGGLERCARAFFICFYVLFVHQIVGTISGHTAAASANNSGHHPAWGVGECELP